MREGLGFAGDRLAPGPSGRPRPGPPPRGEEEGADGGAFLRFLGKFRLTFPIDFRIFHCPGGARARSFQRANPENNRERFLSGPPIGRRRNKALDFREVLRETGNPPLDGTGSLKTEQRRTREGGRKSSPRGGLRDSFEGLVRRDEPGSSGRWLDGLH